MRVGDCENVETCLPIKQRGIEDVVSIPRRKFTTTPTQTLTLLMLHHLLYKCLSAASWGWGLILWRNGHKECTVCFFALGRNLSVLVPIHQKVIIQTQELAVRGDGGVLTITGIFPESSLICTFL